MNLYRNYLLTILIMLYSAGTVFGQVYYVELTERGYEKSIIEKLKHEGYKISENKDGSDYTIVCVIRQTSKINSMYKGYARIDNTKTGKEVGRTEEVRRGAVSINGFNAGSNIFDVIAKKHLDPILNNLKR